MPIISPLFIVFVPCGASTSGAEVLTSLIVQQDCKRHQANDQRNKNGELGHSNHDRPLERLGPGESRFQAIKTL